MCTRSNSRAWLLSATTLLAGCGTVQQAVCPRLPPAPRMEPAPPELSFQDRMRKFLGGSLPTPTESRPTSEPAKGGSKR